VSWAAELEVAVEACAAGVHVLRGFDRAHLGERGKRAFDPVTEADLQSQDTILAVLRQHTPDIEVMAEEGVVSQARTRWIVDPLDGTTNFVHQIPMVGVTVALEVDGEIVVGVTHDLWRDEVFGAVLGGGATLNGDRMRVSAVDHPEKMLLGLGFPSGHRRAEVDLAWVAAALREVGCVRRMGAASLDLAWLAAGRLDGFVELGLQQWDTAAGMLLVREAGGLVTGRAGEAFRPGQDWIVAANPAMHAHVLRWLAT
jgi:myo-inositol-1(or 4)-monophosphatase